MFCTRCGHPNKDGAHFCAKCGAGLQEDTTVTLTPVEVEAEVLEDHAHLQEELEPGQAILIVTRGPNAGSTFLIEAEQAIMSLGRNPESDVFLDDVTVSRRHAEIRRREDGSFRVHDIQSLNGTYVNGERVEETVLATSDEIQIGKFKIVFIRAE